MKNEKKLMEFHIPKSKHKNMGNFGAIH